MISHLDDEDSIRTARSRYNARKTESSLIAWICSPEWAPKLHRSSISGEWMLPSGFRGLPGFNGSAYRTGGAKSYYQSMIATGEIDAV